MQIDLSINPSETTVHLVSFIKQTLKKENFTRLVVGLSGGIDSAISLALGVKAIGTDNIYICMFPYGELNKEGLEDAKLITNEFKIPAENIKTIDIRPLVDPIINLDPEINNIRRGNIMVRMRMILLYDLSKKYDALVLGTENKTENLLGYFTRFGDEASDLEPILSLYKTQVKQLAKYLEIPQKIIDNTPTAGMWLGQTDESEFGFSYEDADKILYLSLDRKYTKEQIIKEGFNSEIVEKALKRMSDNSFKHHLPYFPL